MTTTQSFEQWTQNVTAARRLGDVHRCLETLREGLERAPSDAQHHLFAGECYAALGYYLEALQNYDAAVRLSSNTSHTALEALLCGAALLAELGFYEEAGTRFDAARTLDQPETEGKVGASTRSQTERRQLAVDLALLASRMVHLEDPRGVRDLLERSLAIRDTPEARFELARSYLALGDASKALEHLEEGRRLDGTNPVFQNLAARCYMALGQVKSAKDAIMRAELLGDRSRAGRVLRLESKSWQAPGAS
jgi:tetratricopeptide (TPR) repeat protein